MILCIRVYMKSEVDRVPTVQYNERISKSKEAMEPTQSTVPDCVVFCFLLRWQTHYLSKQGQRRPAAGQLPLTGCSFGGMLIFSLLPP